MTAELASRTPESARSSISHVSIVISTVTLSVLDLVG
jgi:hypothetical protein